MSKKILVIDWLDVYGGAERVAKYLDEVYNFDEVYTLVNVMEDRNLQQMFKNKNLKINTSFLQILGNKFRYALPLFPIAIRSLKIKHKNALIISISHSVAKGILYDSSCNHVSYLVARNMKYVWEEKSLYFTGIKRVFKFIVPYLKKFDVKSSKKPNKIISTSSFVSNWVKEKYNIDSKVIHSPVDVDKFTFEKNKKNYYITVGRLEPYKRFDILINAFNLNKKQLIVIGDGSQKKELELKSENNIEFKGYLETNKINDYIKNAKGFVFGGKEDFGIALIEPQICGTPVIAFAAGGALETIIDKKTGVLFHSQTAKSLNNAINYFEKTIFNADIIRKNAIKFSIENFKSNFNKEINNLN